MRTTARTANHGVHLNETRTLVGESSSCIWACISGWRDGDDVSKRPTITPALKVASLLHRVYLQFGVYLKCPLSGEDMTPEDRIQFDHAHCVKLDGPNVYDNLRPTLVKPHQKKTKADLRMIKKARPGHTETFVVRKFMTADEAIQTIAVKPKRSWPKGKKMPSRPFPKREKVA